MYESLELLFQMFPFHQLAREFGVKTASVCSGTDLLECFSTERKTACLNILAPWRETQKMAACDPSPCSFWESLEPLVTNDKYVQRQHACRVFPPLFWRTLLSKNKKGAWENNYAGRWGSFRSYKKCVLFSIPVFQCCCQFQCAHRHYVSPTLTLREGMIRTWWICRHIVK